MIKKFCDICGKELNEQASHRFRIQEHRLFHNWTEIEICWDCYKALKDRRTERKDDEQSKR